MNQNIEKMSSLIVDLVDSPQNQLIWRGVATNTLPDKPGKNAEMIKKAVAKIFRKYPPKGEEVVPEIVRC